MKKLLIVLIAATLGLTGVAIANENPYERYITVAEVATVDENTIDVETAETVPAYPATIVMDNPCYVNHTKKHVVFSHNTHVKKLENTCVSCHHHKVLPTDPRDDPAIYSCVNCHSKVGKTPRGTKLTESEKLEYHVEAMHTRCKSCHKESNKNAGEKIAPTSCSKCHTEDTTE